MKRNREIRTHRHRGFTLMQLVIVIAVASGLAAILMGVFSRNSSAASRVQCDTRVKAVVMALDAFRQESGQLPNTLDELLEKKYLTDAGVLRCPSDPRPGGSYDDFYVLRSSRDIEELPIIVCPLGSNESGHGIQAFKGRYTKQFATRPAELIAASATVIDRPGKPSIAGRSGMLLRGGDSIRTAAGGSAKLRFADNSVTDIGSSSEITVLQSYIAGHTRAPLYTLIRQTTGNVLYRVTPGSKFDVTTPTATAGALGTEFQIREEASSGNWYLKVTEHKVFCSRDNRTRIYTDGDPDSLIAGIAPTTVPVDTPIYSSGQEVAIGAGSEIETVQEYSSSNKNDGSKSSQKKKKKKKSNDRDEDDD